MNTLPAGFTSRDLGLPTIDVGAYSPIGSTASDSRGRIDTNYQLFGNVSLIEGRHAFKAGYEWRRTFINSFIDSGHRGKLVFSSLDDFLSGTVDGGSSAYGDGTRYSYQNGGGAYLLDSWRMNPKITVNYGLRWDYYGVIGAQNKAFSIFNVKTGSLETIGASGAPSSLYPKSWTNFAPRFSVADDLLGNGKLVIRTGAGMFYDGPSQDFFVGNQAYNTNAGEAGPAFNGIGFASPVVSTISKGVAVFGDYTPSSIFTVDQNLTTPRYYAYNLNIESQLAKNIALQVGYIGSQGRHLFHFRDLNQFNNVAGRTVSCGNGTTIGYGEQCFPSYSTGSFVDIPLYYINQIETSSMSNYNSAQATLKLQKLAQSDFDVELHLGTLDRYGQRRPGLRSQRFTARRQLQSPRRARQFQLRCAPAPAMVLELQSSEVQDGYLDQQWLGTGWHVQLRQRPALYGQLSL